MGKNSKETSRLNYQKSKERIMQERTRSRLLEGKYVKPETIEKYDLRRQHFTSEELTKINPLVMLINKPLIKIKDLSIHWEQLTDLKPLTIKNYQSSIRNLMISLNVSDEASFFLALTDFDRVEKVLLSKTLGTFTNTMTAIISICKHSPIHKEILDDVYHLYYEGMQKRTYENYKNVIKLKQDHFFYDAYVPLWNDVMEVYHDIAEKHPLSKIHLLLATMVLIPPLRDNWANVMFVLNDEEITEGQNYYNISSQKLGLYDQKYAKFKGFVEVEISDELAEILINSLELDPRTYVFEQTNVFQQPNGYPHKSLASLISSIFNFGINDLRHSHSTYLIENDEISWTEKVKMMRASLHTPMTAINEYYYPTANRVIEIDDE